MCVQSRPGGEREGNRKEEKKPFGDQTKNAAPACYACLACPLLCLLRLLVLVPSLSMWRKQL